MTATVIDFQSARARLVAARMRRPRRMVTFKGVRMPAPCTMECPRCGECIHPKEPLWRFSFSDGSLRMRCERCYDAGLPECGAVEAP